MAVSVVVVLVVVLARVGQGQDLATFLQQGQARTLSLEKVVGALRQRGMLDQVDPSLLRRIQAKLGTNLLNEVENQERVLDSRMTESRRLELVRERALERQRKLFGTRPTDRPTWRPERLHQPQLQPARHRLVGGECQALKTENIILKQQLMKETPATTAIDVLKQLQEQGHFQAARAFQQPDSLEQLVAESSIQEMEEIENMLAGRQLRSVLITPTPTISTVLETVSFVTTVTSYITQEIGIYYNGRRIPTHIIETEVEVQTSTSIHTTTVLITPTPTWQTITVTPTVTTPPTPPVDVNSLLLQQKERERQELLQRLHRLQGPARIPAHYGGIKAEVVEIPGQLDSFNSMQQYLEQVRQWRALETETVVAQPLVQESPAQLLPSTTVSTIFLSGSIPGVYTTSHTTITLGQALERNKRAARQLVVATQLPTSLTQAGVQLEGSFSSPVLSLGECKERTVTVTVTTTPHCGP